MLITKDVFKKYLIENGKMSAEDVRHYSNILANIAIDTNVCGCDFYNREANSYKELISEILVSPVYRLKNKKLQGTWDIAIDYFIEMLASMGEVAEECACEETKECACEVKEESKECCCGTVSKEDFVAYLTENTKLVASTIKNYSEGLSNITITLGMDNQPFYGRSTCSYTDLVAAILENETYVTKRNELNKTWNSALKYFSKMLAAK